MYFWQHSCSTCIDFSTCEFFKKHIEHVYFFNMSLFSTCVFENIHFQHEFIFRHAFLAKNTCWTVLKKNRMLMKNTCWKKIACWKKTNVEKCKKHTLKKKSHVEKAKSHVEKKLMLNHRSFCWWEPCPFSTA